MHEIHRIGTAFRKSEWYHRINSAQTNDDDGGVFTIIDPRKAIARRKLFLRAGSRAMVEDWDDEVMQVVELTVSKIKRDLEKEGKVDVMKWWTFMTADVMGMLCFGDSFRMVENEKVCILCLSKKAVEFTEQSQRAPLLQDIAEVFRVMELQVEVPWTLSLMEFLGIPLTRRLPGMKERFIEHSNKAIENTREVAKASTRTLFSKMADPDQQPVPDHVVRNEATNLLAAGSDTTMLALTYLVYAVLSDETKSIKSRLIEELKAHSDRPTLAELDSMPFLNNMIKETLRLYAPIAGTLPRVTPEEGVVFAGYKIPRGTIVGTQALTLHTNPAVWKDPMK